MAGTTVWYRSTCDYDTCRIIKRRKIRYFSEFVVLAGAENIRTRSTTHHIAISGI